MCNISVRIERGPRLEKMGREALGPRISNPECSKSLWKQWCVHASTLKSLQKNYGICIPRPSNHGTNHGGCIPRGSSRYRNNDVCNKNDSFLHVFIAFQDQQMWFHTVILKCVRSYLMFYPRFFYIMDPESYFYTCFLHVSEHMCRFTA